MDLSKLNYIAVLVSAVVAFVIGGMWYSPLLFGKAWQRETGLTDDRLQRRNPGKIMGTAFVLTLIMAFNLAAFLGSGPRDVVWGITAGALAGIGWVALSFGVTYLFEERSMKLFLINAGYHAIAFMVMGGILNVWK